MLFLGWFEFRSFWKGRFFHRRGNTAADKAPLIHLLPLISSHPKREEFQKESSRPCPLRAFCNRTSRHGSPRHDTGECALPPVEKPWTDYRQHTLEESPANFLEDSDPSFCHSRRLLAPSSFDQGAASAVLVEISHTSFLPGCYLYTTDRARARAASAVALCPEHAAASLDRACAQA